MWGQRELAGLGLEPELDNIGRSLNKTKGTFRGMHFQVAPYEETKLIYCVRGKIFDIALDLRSGSPTYCEWFGVELSGDGNTALYVPRGVAHGFQTLVDDTEVLYFISGEYAFTSASGARWNDPRFGITLPLPVTIINRRDLEYPDFVL